MLDAERRVGARVRQRDREAIAVLLSRRCRRRPVPRRLLDGVRLGGDGHSDHVAAARHLHGSSLPRPLLDSSHGACERASACALV